MSTSKPLRRLLIANRGEIAVRVLRGCRDLGVSPVAVFSDADRLARHVRMADAAVRLGPAPSAESYLRTDAILDAARATEADSIHPGYGFLSENAEFAREVMAAGLTWVGPPPDAIEAMGDKGTARARMIEAGVPVVPGVGEITDEEAAARAERIGYPVMIKAVAGGGGKGMRRVDSAEELPSALAMARSEAASAFGNDTMALEKFLERPHHVEVQVFGGPDGKSIHLGERDCSTQRRHQKLVEEAPSPVVDARLREAMGQVAVAAADAVDYVGAGTVEFLVDPHDRDENGMSKFYFLEMNTRLQVEHPVTELVTGTDLVLWQLAVAAGEPLPMKQEDLTLQGHALECRIYAEDPEMNFAPSPGTLVEYQPPDGPGVRCDSGVQEGDEISIHYDPMIAKLLTWGPDRPAAIERMKRALSEFVISGLRTSIPFHLHLLDLPEFHEGSVHVNHVDRALKDGLGSLTDLPEDDLPLAVSVAALDELLHARRHALRPAPTLSPWAEGGRRSLKERR
ncbi:MAG: acetyl-CoA carboxylase biotin carboxylase subunit [Acidobacteriota bacterium]